MINSLYIAVLQVFFGAVVWKKRLANIDQFLL